MGAVKDRTIEFMATVDSLLGRSAAGIAAIQDPLLGGGARSPKNQNRSHSEFTRRATEINCGIQHVLGKLEKLTKCTLALQFGFITCSGKEQDTV